MLMCALILAAAALPTPLQGGVGAPSQPAVVEKVGENQFRIGRIHVDTAKREIVVPGRVNDVTTLEFVANTEKGFKAYESALTLETDAITFNAALLLIGLDKTHARVPTRHFDPEPPQGDPVEMWVEWDILRSHQRMRVEGLMFDKRTNRTLPEGPWVYTGSTFMPDGRYMADLDGVLIGFVHSPAPIIENPRSGAVGGFGSVVLNRRPDLPPGTRVTLTVRALPITDTPAK